MLRYWIRQLWSKRERTPQMRLELRLFTFLVHMGLCHLTLAISPWKVFKARKMQPDGGEAQVEGEDVDVASGEELDLDAPELPMDDDVAAGHPKPRGPNASKAARKTKTPATFNIAMMPIGVNITEA